MKNVFVFSSFIILSLAFSACNKVEGPGGSSVIKGKIFIEVKDGAGNIINSYYAPKEDVFIVYGGGDTNYFDDKIETTHTGLFEFRYLEKGTYTIFAYSDCNTCPSGKEIVSVDVEIKEKGQVVDLDDIIITD